MVLFHPFSASGQDFVDDIGDKSVGVVFVFGGDGVSGQESGGEIDGLGIVEGDDGIELFDFRREIEAVAGFSFGGGGAML